MTANIPTKTEFALRLRSLTSLGENARAVSGTIRGSLVASIYDFDKFTSGYAGNSTLVRSTARRTSMTVAK
jgi:hypothetical protein